tara:strand:- start:281 stop:766 length:486 start_codon:yes stop_codon:yes gene_type:complete
MSTRRTVSDRAPARTSNFDHILRTGLMHANALAKNGSDIGGYWTNEENNNHAKYFPDMNMLWVHGTGGDFDRVLVSTDPYNPSLFHDKDDKFKTLQLRIPENKPSEPNKYMVNDPSEPNKYMVRSARVKGWVFYVFDGDVSIRGTKRLYVVARPEADVRAQ